VFSTILLNEDDHRLQRRFENAVAAN